jgi:D-alanyl-D-alanine carboxypeptidase/D-alanyl-D-alanine-endopeptidase (penicillin-binding protein 4)
MKPIRRTIPVVLAVLAAACASARPALAPVPTAGPTAVRTHTPIAAALDSIFDDTLFANAHWGVLVKSLRTGETVYARNAGRMFVPASNMKIVTAAAAVEALGPEYRYRTRVGAAGPVRNGVLNGDLVVAGGGDPSISQRMAGDVSTVFRAWADSLRARGVQRITGGVVGVDDVFDDVPYGRGWAWDDMDAPYSAEVGGLQLNEGFVTVRAEPGPGGTARVTVRPAAAGWVDVSGTVSVGAAGSETRLRVERAETSGGLTVSGSIAADTAFVEETVAIRNNTAFFAAALRQALVEAGIRVDGGAWDADQRQGVAPSPAVLFTHTSPPMSEILAAFMKPSQNQIGEILLKTLGAELRGMGSAGAGIAVVDSLARAWGMPPRQLQQADGSGLSRYNLVAPAFLVALLERESRSPNAQVFTASLPIAGRDGTLASRMRGTPAEGNLRAKTGTLSGVRALSGYFTTAAGEPLVFSILMNHHTLSSRDVDRVAEAAIMRLIGSAR